MSSWGVSQRDGARGSAGAAAPDSDPRGHASAAEVFKLALEHLGHFVYVSAAVVLYLAYRAELHGTHGEGK